MTGKLYSMDEILDELDTSRPFLVEQLRHHLSLQAARADVQALELAADELGQRLRDEDRTEYLVDQMTELVVSTTQAVAAVQTKLPSPEVRSAIVRAVTIAYAHTSRAFTEKDVATVFAWLANT